MPFKAMHEQDGTSPETAAANDAAILEHFQTLKGELALPYGGFLFRKSIQTLNGNGAQNWGGKIKGSGGQVITLPEEFYKPNWGTGQIGGSATRLVLDNQNRALIDNAFLIIDTAELEIESIVLQGFWHPTDRDEIIGDHVKPNWPEIGILVKKDAHPPSVGGGPSVGMGKLHALALTLCAFKIAIQCGEAEQDQNADQLFIGELHTQNCNIGIKLKNVTSVGHWIAQYEGIYTDVMLDIERGGKLHGGNWTLIHRNGTMIRVSGNVGSEAAVTIDHVIVDANVEMDEGSGPGVGRIIDMTDVNGGAFSCTIGTLNIDSTLTMKDSIRIRQRAQLDILSGMFLRNEMIQVTSLMDFPTHRAHITVSNCTFKEGHSPYNLISSTSGTVNAAFLIEVKGCRSETGTPFPDAKWSRDNAGNITVHYHDSPAQISTALGTAYFLTDVFGQYIFTGAGAVSPSLTRIRPIPDGGSHSLRISTSTTSRFLRARTSLPNSNELTIRRRTSRRGRAHYLQV